MQNAYTPGFSYSARKKNKMKLFVGKWIENVKKNRMINKLSRLKYHVFFSSVVKFRYTHTPI